MPVSVLTQHNDPGRSGANLGETLLTPDTVDVNQFGKLFECPVDGQIYAQPLYVPNVRVTNEQGAVGTRDVVYVATMRNSLYAFDAATGVRLWRRQIEGKPPVPARFYDTGYQDISDDDKRFIGILSTPVIDAKVDPAGVAPTTGTLYLTLFTSDLTVFNKDTIRTNGSQFHHLLYAIDIGTGDKIAPTGGGQNPVAIGEGDSGVVPGSGYTAKPHGPNDPTKIKTAPDGTVSVGGTPPGSGNRPISLLNAAGTEGVPVMIADGLTQSGVDHVRFNPMQHMQRPGLLLHQGRIIVCFGSHGDFRPYHGWVFAFDAATLAPRGALCTSPNGGEAGVWQAGEGPVVDADGRILVGTGNGDTTTNATTTVAPNLGESFLRLAFDAAGLLTLDGFFNPFIDRELNPQNTPGASQADDDDLGAASPTMLPDGMAVGGGKDGRFYLVDPSKFGRKPGIGGAPGTLLQSFDASFGPGSPTPLTNDKFPTHHIHGSPVVYNSAEEGILVYVWGENDVLRVFRYDPATQRFRGQPATPSATLTTPTARGDVYASMDIKSRSGMPGGILSLSAQTPAGGGPASDGIVWGSFPPFQDANRNVCGGALIAYDAARWDHSDPNQPPRIVAIWSSLQNPQRDRNAGGGAAKPQQFAKFCAPTVAAGRVYLPTFNRPQGALYVYGRLPAADGGYNVGFGGASGLMLNGTAQVVAGQGVVGGNAIALTAGAHLFQKSSVFATARQDVSKFHTTFDVTLTPDPNMPQMADGFTFIVQGQGPRALGGAGAGLGFGPNAADVNAFDPTAPQPNNPGYAIQSSVAIRFGLFQNGQSVSLTGVYTRGQFPAASPGDQSTLDANVDLRRGNRLRVAVHYDGMAISWTIADTVTGSVFTATPVPVALTGITGPTAFVGFTGATGGFTVTITLHVWEFIAGQA